MNEINKGVPMDDDSIDAVLNDIGVKSATPVREVATRRTLGAAVAAALVSDVGATIQRIPKVTRTKADTFASLPRHLQKQIYREHTRALRLSQQEVTQDDVDRANAAQAKRARRAAKLAKQGL